MPLGPAGLDVELVEDRLRLRIPRLRLPLGSQPRVDVVEAVVRVEHTPDDQLRRNCSVPAVLLQPERDVVATHAPVAVELRALPEGDRAAGIAAVAMDAETQVLALADRDQI